MGIFHPGKLGRRSILLLVASKFEFPGLPGSIVMAERVSSGRRPVSSFTGGRFPDKPSLWKRDDVCKYLLGVL